MRSLALPRKTALKMPTFSSQETSAPSHQQIECGSCQQKLPLCLTKHDEPAAVWLCARCNVPFVACCVKKALLRNAQLIRLDERYFDVAEQPAVSIRERQVAIQLAKRAIEKSYLQQRRSERVAQLLVVPAIKIESGFTPIDDPFQIMVANLSIEGVGLVHDGPINTEYVALELSPHSQSPIQVIVRLVRQRELTPPFYELGGEFLVRLGSVASHKVS